LVADQAQIFELPPEVFDILSTLDRWVAVDELPGVDDLIGDLADAGMLEWHR